MTMGDFGVARDKWVCPTDRELSLRAQLRTGWSVKTNSINSFNKPEQLNDTEQEAIMNVIKKAEFLEKVEQERVGRLVERLDNMRKNAMGNGTTQCVLCADEFGILGASPLLCNDCKKAVCTKCGVDTLSAHKEPLWLCKICAETRETWKKSGAWFYKGLPKYILPGRKNDRQASKYNAGPSSGRVPPEHPTSSPIRSYNAWLQNKGRNSSEKEATDSSDDELKAARLSRKATSRRHFAESVESIESNLAISSPPPDVSAGVASSPHYTDVSCPVDTTRISGSPNAYSRDYEQDVYKSPAKSTSELGPAGSSSWFKPRRTEYEEEEYVPEKNIRSHVRQDSQQSIASTGSGGRPRPPNSPRHHLQQQQHSREASQEGATLEEKPSPDESTSMLEFSLLHDPNHQALHCTIYRAKGLKGTDCDGLADPFVRLQLLPMQNKADKVRTRTVHKTVNPEFNETVSFFGVTDFDITKRILRLSVLDEDLFGLNFLGETRMSIKKIKPFQASRFYVYLDRTIQVEEGDEEDDTPGRGQILISLMYTNDHNALVVTILRCTHLPPRDPTNDRATCDPYVRLQLKPDHLRRRYKTSTKKKTLNPEYNEEFLFEISPHEVSKKMIEITVWDKDYGKTDDYIGGLALGVQSKGDRLCHWLDAVRNPDRRIERWHQLSSTVLID